MFEIFFYSILILILFTPFGYFLIQNFESNLYGFSKQLIFGSVILSFLAITIHFFFPLNLITNSIILIFSLIILIKKRKSYFTKNFIIFLTLQSLLITILITESHVYRPDAGLYHLPFIGILNAEKINLGISNIHERYGHTSIIQYFSAISINFLFDDFGIVFAQAIIAVSVMINFSYLVYNYVKKKIFNFHFYFLFFILIYIFYKMNRYGEYGNDAPAHFLFYFLISELILHIEDKNSSNIINNLIITLFIIQNKVLLISVLIFNFINIPKINFKKIIYEKNLYFLIILFFFWAINNVLSTGCMLYPVKVTCFESLSWTSMEKIEQISIASEAWAKGWSVLNQATKDKMDQLRFIENFYWLKIWSKTHLQLILKILLPYIIVVFLIILFLNKKSQKKISDTYKKLNTKKYEKYLILFAIFNVLFWFLKAPIYRYGYSTIITLIALSAAYFMSRKKIDYQLMNKLVITIFIIGFSVIFIKNQYRIIKSNNDYVNYPWPRYYSMDNSNEMTNFKVQKLKDKDILIPINGYCMYLKKICGHYPLYKNLDIKKIRNYDILYLKNR